MNEELKKQLEDVQVKMDITTKQLEAFDFEEVLRQRELQEQAFLKEGSRLEEYDQWDKNKDAAYYARYTIELEQRIQGLKERIENSFIEDKKEDTEEARALEEPLPEEKHRETGIFAAIKNWWRRLWAPSPVKQANKAINDARMAEAVQIKEQDEHRERQLSEEAKLEQASLLELDELDKKYARWEQEMRQNIGIEPLKGRNDLRQLVKPPVRPYTVNKKEFLDKLSRGRWRWDKSDKIAADEKKDPQFLAAHKFMRELGHGNFSTMVYDNTDELRIHENVLSREQMEKLISSGTEESVLEVMSEFLNFSPEAFLKKYPVHKMTYEQRAAHFREYSDELARFNSLFQWCCAFGIPLLSKESLDKFELASKLVSNTASVVLMGDVTPDCSFEMMYEKIIMQPVESVKRGVIALHGISAVKQESKQQLADNSHLLELGSNEEQMEALRVLMPLLKTDDVGSLENAVNKLNVQHKGFSLVKKDNVITGIRTPVPFDTLKKLSKGDSKAHKELRDKLQGMSWLREDGTVRAAMWDADTEFMAKEFADNFAYFSDMKLAGILLEGYGMTKAAGFTSLPKSVRTDLTDRAALAKRTVSMLDYIDLDVRSRYSRQFENCKLSKTWIERQLIADRKKARQLNELAEKQSNRALKNESKGLSPAERMLNDIYSASTPELLSAIERRLDLGKLGKLGKAEPELREALRLRRAALKIEAPPPETKQEEKKEEDKKVEKKEEKSESTEQSTTLHQPTELERERIRTEGDPVKIEQYLNGHSGLSRSETRELRFRMQTMQKIRGMAGTIEKQKPAQQFSNGNRDVLLPHAHEPARQTTRNGCWSVSYQTLLAYRGAQLTQDEIRAYRPDTKTDMPEELSQLSKRMNGDNMNEILDFADLAMELLPNTCMNHINIAIGNDESAFAEQVFNTVRTALTEHNSPVSMLRTMHYVTIVGIQGETLLYKNPMGKTPDETHTLTKKELANLARHSSGSTIILDWLQDMEVSGGQSQQTTDETNGMAGYDQGLLNIVQDYSRQEVSHTKGMVYEDLFGQNPLQKYLPLRVKG